MYELNKMERYLRVYLLGPGSRLMKNNLSGRGLTNVEKRCSRPYCSMPPRCVHNISIVTSRYSTEKFTASASFLLRFGE